MIQKIAENIWAHPSPMRLLGVEMQRSTTVIRHGDSLSLISPTDEMDSAAIHSLGEVKHVVAPTHFHDTGMKTAAKEFPDATLWGVPSLAKVLPELDLRPLGEDNLPDEWTGQLTCLHITGMPRVNEQVLWHPSTGTLITSDLLFNIRPPADGWTRLFFKFNGAWERPGPTRIFRSFIKSKPDFRDSIQQLQALPVRCILPSHGQPIIEQSEIESALNRLNEI